MPITIKQNTFKYRNPDTGDYDGVDVLAETTVDELIADIEEVAEDQIDAIEAKGEEVLESIPSDYSDLEQKVKNAYVHPILAGPAPIVSIVDGAEDMPLSGHIVNFSPVQSGSGDPAPDNVRSISGWTGANVVKTGKNLIDVEDFTLVKPSQRTKGITFSNPIPPGEYTISLNVVSNSMTKNGTFSIRDYSGPEYTSVKDISILSGQTGLIESTFTANIWFGYIYVYESASDVDDCVLEIADIQLELGSTATAYEPYQGDVYIADWTDEAGTVYGGYVDLVKGEVVAEWASVDMGTLTWIYDTTNLRFYTTSLSNVIKKGIPTNAIICELYKTKDTIGTSNIENCMITQNSASNVSTGVILLRDDAYTDSQTFETAVSGTKLVYQLATPTHTSITHVILNTLYGANNIWSNLNGDTSIEYSADVKLYMEAQGYVQDVQVNGTSVVADGVANVPLAGSSAPGVGKVDSSYGTGMIQDYFCVSGASDYAIKNGDNNYRPIVAGNQHKSVFYGLAKAASDTTQSQSSNAVGTYTDAAKVAIQKMLGIYEAPWELIRNDTVTNETAAQTVISTDGNGEPFQLTDAKIVIWVDAQTPNPIIADYGRIWFMQGNDSIRCVYLINSPSITVTTKKIAYSSITRDKNTLEVSYCEFEGVASHAIIRQTASTDENAVNTPFGITTNTYFDKIKIGEITGTFSYRLYGKRKWTT